MKPMRYLWPMAAVIGAAIGSFIGLPFGAGPSLAHDIVTFILVGSVTGPIAYWLGRKADGL